MPGLLNQLVIFDKGTEVSDMVFSYTITAYRQFDRELPANVFLLQYEHKPYQAPVSLY